MSDFQCKQLRIFLTKKNEFRFEEFVFEKEKN